MRVANIVVSAMLAATGLWGQAGRGGPIKSPEVSPDGRVTFRLRAPNAKEVFVTGIGQRLAMQKNEQGVWTATTDPLKPDIYVYSFSVDGATFSDPGNPRLMSAYGSAGLSMVSVPGPVAWEPGDGPRGVVAHHTFRSRIIGDERDYYVYTPPNYDDNRSDPYPVLFLLHGLGDDAAAWLNVGAANTILDNLINQGRAKPMVMVNTLGYGTANGPAGSMNANMIPAFAKSLVEEVLPQVEKSYHVAKDRNLRAIAGLSMGGAESLYTGLNYLDHFAYIGSFSGAFSMWPRANPPAPAGGGQTSDAQTRDAADFEKIFPNLSAKTNSQLRLVWISCGLDDGLLGVNRQFKEWMRTKGIHFTDVEVPGYAHAWPLWRRNLTELAPLLFQASKR